MGRWMRRYRKAKKASGKIKGWFTNDPMSAAHKPKMVTTVRASGKNKSAWDSQKLSGGGRYPTPAWQTLESGKRVYGPVRDAGGWIFTDEEGKTVYSKDDRRKALKKEGEYKSRMSSRPKKPGKICGKKRADGKRCQFVGDCPHHRNRMT